MSDAEMVSMAEASTQGEKTAVEPVTPKLSDGNLSRSDIFREACVGSQLKDLRNKPQGPTGNDNSKRGKRVYEVSSGGESNGSKGSSYAEVAGVDEWLKPKSKKKKKKAKFDEPVLDLLGVKESPNKEIFVMSLDYSRCRRTEQLENMVKHYCRQRGVEVLYAKAFRTQSDPKKANCKISVNEADVPSVFADGFWPDYVDARYWYNNNDKPYAGNDRSSDDDSLSE